MGPASSPIVNAIMGFGFYLFKDILFFYFGGCFLDNSLTKKGEETP